MEKGRIELLNAKIMRIQRELAKTIQERDAVLNIVQSNDMKSENDVEALVREQGLLQEVLQLDGINIGISDGEDIKPNLVVKEEQEEPEPEHEEIEYLESEFEEHLEEEPIKVPYYCLICSTVFDNDYFLTKHRRVHSENMQFSCEECHWGFRSLVELKTHLYYHLGKRPFLCEICGMALSTNSKLNAHIDEAHSCSSVKKCQLCNKYINIRSFQRHNLLFHNQKYECDYCDEIFLWEAPFTAHVMSHYNKVKYRCSVCNRGFPFEFMVKPHMERHKVNFTCEICRKVFSFKHRLLLHIRKHLGIKRYLCTICDKGFISSNALAIHEQKYHGRATNFRRPLKPEKDGLVLSVSCCGKRFSNHSDAQYHKKEDHGAFQCKECGKALSSVHSLKIHMRIHTGERPYKCNYCEKQFSQKAQCQQHMMGHTGEKPHECEVCQKRFRYGHEKKVHMRQHTGERPFECDYCAKTFIQRAHWTVHVRTHTGEKPYKCDFCEKQFVTLSAKKDHSFTHTEIKRYQCMNCNQSFMRRPKLMDHICVMTLDHVL